MLPILLSLLEQIALEIAAKEKPVAIAYLQEQLAKATSPVVKLAIQIALWELSVLPV